MVKPASWLFNQCAYSRRVFALVSYLAPVTCYAIGNSFILQINLPRRWEVMHVRSPHGLPADCILKCRICFKRIQVLATWIECVLYSTSSSFNLSFFFSFLEVVLVLLLEKLEFSLSDKNIVWQMTPIVTPNIDMVSTIPTMPMKLSLVDSTVWSTVFLSYYQYPRVDT